MQNKPEPGARIMSATKAADVDFYGHEHLTRRWAIEQALKFAAIGDDASEIVDDAKLIEAYVKGSE